MRTLAASDSALYVGGDFFTYRGTATRNLAKLDLTTGALDTSFGLPNEQRSSGSVNGVTLAAGLLFVGGSFNAYGRDQRGAHGVVLSPGTGRF